MSKQIKIKFVNLDNVGEKYYPVPARNFIPDWYKQTQNETRSARESKSPIARYLDNGGGTPSTIKRCMPVFDSITAGYIMFTHEDFVIDGPKGEAPFFYWINNSKPVIGFQTKEQAEKHPAVTHDIPKWKSAWGITTPPGYSCLFVDPLHREESPLRALEAVVDTDTYISKIQFPFMLKDPDWRGLVPAGTPIIQVIPFRREQYKMEVSDTVDDKLKIERNTNQLRSNFVNAYKRMFWSKKSYL